MSFIPLKPNLSITGTRFHKMYSFSCGNTVPIYDVLSIYGLNQLIGYAKFNNKEYGEVLYRGENKLHQGLVPSLFRNRNGTSRWNKYISPLINKIIRSNGISGAINCGTDLSLARHKVEGMLQHYGVQTRFIDLVDNHWVALWMGLYKCISNKMIDTYYHYEKRTVPLIEMAIDDLDTDTLLFQYILLLALPKSINPSKDGIEQSDDFIWVDLRQALPSVFLRPHSQHGMVARKKAKPGKFATEYDMATEVIGILRIRIDQASQWLGEGHLLSQDNLFPSPMNDYGYDLLLHLPDNFFPNDFAISKYV